jgi:hypothetical protein
MEWKRRGGSFIDESKEVKQYIGKIQVIGIQIDIG